MDFFLPVNPLKFKKTKLWRKFIHKINMFIHLAFSTKKKKETEGKKKKKKKISAWQKSCYAVHQRSNVVHRGKEDDDKKQKKTRKNKNKKKMKKKGLQHWGFECGHPPFY